MADVARLAQVSTAVVSYVMHDGPRPVAVDTARRVRAAIDALGYVPNLSASTLRRGRVQMFGLLMPDWTNPFYAELSLAVEAEAQSLDQVAVSLSHHDDPIGQDRALNSLRRRGVVDVLIASPPDIESSRAIPGMRTVYMDRAIAVEGAVTLGVDATAGAELAVSHLVEHGYTDIAMVSGETRYRLREQGWRRGLRAAGLRVGLLRRGPFTWEGGYAMARSLLSARNRPQAIFASSDLQAFGVIRAARDRGLSVPGDVAVVSFDGTQRSEYSWPSLTAVQQPLRPMARAAVRNLLRVDGPSAGHQSFDMELVVRESCGCV